MYELWNKKLNVNLINKFKHSITWMANQRVRTTSGRTGTINSSGFITYDPVPTTPAPTSSPLAPPSFTSFSINTLTMTPTSMSHVKVYTIIVVYTDGHVNSQS